MMTKKIIIYCLLIGTTVIGCNLKIANPYPSSNQEENRNQNVKMIEPDIAIIDLLNNFVQVKAGKFTMGSDIKKDTMPVHSVSLKTFYISKYEVSVEAYAYFLNQTGYKYDYTVNKESNIRELNGKYYVKETEKSYPIVNVSWDDANNFCKWLSMKSGEKIELPTEAQWEKAARGGNYSEGYLYSGSNDADEVAWYTQVAEGIINPVGQKRPNELGIYDMSGNVWEWCRDWYMKDYYAISPKKDPSGPTWGTARVYRGGSWYLTAEFLQPAIRHYLSLDSRFKDLGFRIVKNINVHGDKKYTSVSPEPKGCAQRNYLACASAACGMLMRYWSNAFLDGKRLFMDKLCNYSYIFKKKFGTYNGSSDNWQDILSAIVEIGNDKLYLNVEREKISIKSEAFQLHGGKYLKLISHINAKNDPDMSRKTVSPWDRPGVLTYVTNIDYKDNKTIIQSHAVLAYGYRIETTESGYTLWFQVLDGRMSRNMRRTIRRLTGKNIGSKIFKRSMAFHFTNNHEYTDADPSLRFFKRTKNRFIVIWPEIKQ